MIAVIDYGAGNLFSVGNALEYLSLRSTFTRDPSEIRAADKIILPGVGAFPDAMKMLEEAGLIAVLQEEAVKKPFLGICLGMQMLFETGMEFGETKGLGLLPGTVQALEAPGRKIPHMGWSQLKLLNPCPLSQGIEEGDMVYFVHSFRAETTDDCISMYTEYGERIPAMVWNGQVYGTQFHPEKSGTVGLSILRNFGGST